MIEFRRFNFLDENYLHSNQATFYAFLTKSMTNLNNLAVIKKCVRFLCFN